MAPSTEDFKDEFPTLSKSLSKYFTSGEFSDMKIKCGETVHAVHRAVVCGQSSFFANAMKEKHNFKEAQTNTIELDHDHPTTIKAVLEYLYLEKYSDTGLGDNFKDRITLHIDVYVVADKYEIGGLRKYSADQVEEILGSEDEETARDYLAQLINHAWGLLAENDKVLRPLLVEIVSKHIHELIRETKFLALTEGITGFSTALFELAMAKNTASLKLMEFKNNTLIAESNGSGWYKCPDCKKEVGFVPYYERRPNWDNSGESCCPSCGAVYQNDEWDDFRTTLADPGPTGWVLPMN